MDEDNNQPNQEEKSEIEKLQDELAAITDSWKRVAADFENFKRRNEQEQKDLFNFAKQACIVKLLPTLDAFSQALKHLPELKKKEGENTSDDGEFQKNYQTWQVGINGILANLDKVLTELGVNKIEAVGKKFDPHFHEAVRQEESEKEDGTVILELQTGYELSGKVIRPAQVVIAKKKVT